MAVKAIIILCAQACFMQCVIGQCLGSIGIAFPGLVSPGLVGPGLAYDSLGLGPGCVVSTGGSFPVTSASPVAPTGVNVLSENLYEGSLLVEGNLPVLGSVGLEGVMGTAGDGAISYGCGDGVIGIDAEEGPTVTGILAPGLVGPSLAAGVLAPGSVYGSGLNGAGIGARCGNGYGVIY